MLIEFGQLVIAEDLLEAGIPSLPISGGIAKIGKLIEEPLLEPLGASDRSSSEERIFIDSHDDSTRDILVPYYPITVDVEMAKIGYEDKRSERQAAIARESEAPIAPSEPAASGGERATMQAALGSID